jgi:AAA domain
VEELLIPVSVFQNKDDNRPVEHRLPWQSLVERLCRYDTREQKDGKAWSPVTYLPGTTRGKANVDQVFALVLDLDHGSPPWDLLEGLEYVAHTTFQHTPEAPRWRVVLPLLRPVGGIDWPSFWLRAHAHFGGCVDPATKDASRLFYLPSCPPGAEHDVRVRHGEVLDPDSVPEVASYEPPPRRNTPRAVLSRHLADWAQRFALSRIEQVAHERHPGRNNACNRAAYLLGGLIAEPSHGLTVQWVAEELFDACEHNGLVADDGEASVRKTIQSGLTAGLTRPWSPADQEDPPPSPGRIHGTGSQARLEAARGLQLKIERMSEVKSEPIQWLWRNKLALGKATLLMGDPGLGKSLISHWLASMVSVGGEWPDEGTCEQGAAILFTIEDALGDTVAPRLEAAGADRTRVVAVSGVVDLETSLDERMFALEEHVSLLEQLIEREHATLVVMDPVTAYLGSNINAHKDTDVRRVLAPLQMMAERTGVALLLLMHLTKGSGVSALYRATGSIAFPAVCRVVLGVAPDPNDQEGQRRVLVPVKFNIAPEAKGIGYHIETTQQQILPHVDERDQPPVIIWDNLPVLVDATSALDRSGTVQEMGALAECKAAITQIMSQPPYRILAREGERQLKEAGASTSPQIVVRARRELGIKSTKDSFAGPWYWEGTPKILARARVHVDSRSLGKDRNGSAGDEVTKTSAKTAEEFSKNQQEYEESSRAYARTREPLESKEVRYCAICGEHLEVWLYDAHLPCRGQRCPTHGKYFDEHECEVLEA